MIIDVEKGEVLGNSFYKFEQLDLQKKILIFSNDDKTIDLVKAEIMLVNDISRLDMASLYRKIYGFFSIIILSKESISITSDPYGLIKFYHYAKEKKKFISDNLLDFKGLDLTPDKEAIKYFFITSYTPSKHTFFNEVKKIPPCSINNLSLENGYQIESNLYGDFGPSILEKKDLLEKFKHEMSSSLSFFKKNYKSLEFSLSGGLDSVFLIKLYKFSSFKFVSTKPSFCVVFECTNTLLTNTSKLPVAPSSFLPTIFNCLIFLINFFFILPAKSSNLGA